MSTLSDLQAYGQQVAAQYGIPWPVFNWQINQESGWNPNAQSSTSSAHGIAQLISGTAKMFGVNSSDPYQSLSAAAQYDAQLYQQTGSWTGALTQYGTLANASASTMASFNSVLSGLGIAGSGTSSGTGGTGTSTANGATAGQVAESDSFVMKIAMIVLGIVLIGGAIIVYKK